MTNIDQEVLIKISRSLNFVTSFCFCASFILWFTNKNLKKSNEYAVTRVFNFILGSRKRALIELILLTGTVLFIAMKNDFDKHSTALNWTSALYSLVGLFAAMLFIKWKTDKFRATRYLKSGFLIWAVLQFLIPLKVFIGESQMLVLGFSLSLFAKILILTGIFRWSVDFTRVSQRKIERELLEKEEFERSSQVFKGILKETFHEIHTPLRDLEKSITNLYTKLSREYRFDVAGLESNFERVRSIISFSKNSYNQGEIFADDTNEDTALPEDTGMNAINVNTLIEASSSSVKNEFKAKKIDIEFVKNYSAKCFILCSQSQIIQLFVNLFKNAVEAYTDEATRKIVIRTYIEPESNSNIQKYVMIEIEDYGHGIAPELRDIVWEAGYSTKKRDEFKTITGQGLHVVREIIASHKGSSIVMESPLKRGRENTIQGTRFILRFPKAQIIKLKE
ncbi:MAG TPA: ATP-binding protein [Chitinophagaceae bacterium]|nr:ATP-binding protein [Chitinophagaceae bacterium]